MAPFGNDKEYLRAIKRLMEENGAQVPLFTSDGAWDAALEAGSLIEDGVLATANFGSRSGRTWTCWKHFSEGTGGDGPDVHGVLGWLVQPVEGKNHHQGPGGSGHGSGGAVKAGQHQSLYVPGRYQFWILQRMFCQRIHGPAPDYIL